MGFIARIKGEEPGIIKKLPHVLRGKGHYGEYLTEYALEHGNLGNTVVFSNVIVPRLSGSTSTSEIDVVMLHEKGIFVIESKNYSGWIFGTAEQRNWTISFNAKSKVHFNNPINQNRVHVRALSDWLGLGTSAFHSYIVFSKRCELKKVPPNTAEYSICKRHHLLHILRKDLERLDPIFDAATFTRLHESLTRLKEGSTPEAHAQHIKETWRIASGDICPRCGSALVRRNGKYGPFLGCSAYPKCRFTRNI